MALSQANLRRKIYGCWLGKAVGGTLGTPHEGKTGPLALTFYDPVPQGSLPNDDLDLQVVWLYYLRTAKARCVTPEILAQAWQKHVLFPFDEYAIARRNRAWGLEGPLQGASDNYFGECMGAAIRSEVWACIAPGDPNRAAGFAWADAVVDHCGEGVWAEVFHAVIESAAFVESDRDKLIALGLSHLPKNSRLRAALLDTITWWADSQDWRKVQGQVMDKYYTGNFTDVVCNLCFELIGWFDGGDDFGRAICTAVNCGLDTDCTGATLGALLGIINPDCIPAKWRAPIGEEVVLNKTIVNLTKPKDLAELTDWTVELGEQLAGCQPNPGATMPRHPADYRTAVRPMAIEQGDADDVAVFNAQQAPRLIAAQPGTLYGFWSVWTRKDFPRGIRLIRLKFELTTTADVKLLLFYKPRSAAWIDGRHVLTVNGRDIDADPFLAPSFHRAGVASTVIAGLAAGPHELLLALQAPEAANQADLAFGLADPVTNLWLPDVFGKSGK
jgi:hypothetical protein